MAENVWPQPWLQVPGQLTQNDGIYRFARKTWNSVGIDNYTAPPAQNPDLFEVLTNVLPPQTGVLRRRWGTQGFAPIEDFGGISGDGSLAIATPIIKANRMAIYQNLAVSMRTIIALAADGTGVNSLTNNIGYWNAAGTFTTIFTPSVGANNPRVVVSRDYAYFTDGVAADQQKWNSVTGLSKWGISAPTVAATLSVVNSTTAGAWSAATEFTTMGLLKDSAGNMQQLISVNADSSNPAPSQVGTSGVGDPTWNQTSGGTTTDGAITWTNRGPIGLWLPNHLYSEGHFGSGTLAAPAIIYDPVTNALYFNNQGGGGTSGSVKPSFVATIGGITVDGAIPPGVGGNRWEFLGFVADLSPGTVHAWLPSHAYTLWGATNNFSGAAVTEPASIPNAYNTTTGQFNNTIYLQSSGNAASSSASFANPVFAITSGGVTTDKQLEWLCLGSATWTGSVGVTQWAGQGVPFTAIFDGANFQVCTQTGVTNNTPPTWATVYGAQTPDGSATWGCVGQLTSWAASTKWFLPTGGFAAPSSTSSYGGATIKDTNNNIEAVIQSGLSGGSAPAWNPVGQTTTDNTITWFDTSPVSSIAGLITLIKGRQYFIVFNNPVTGGISDLNPVSVSSGVVTNGQIFLSNLPVSTDPQVTTKTLLATADGGNQQVLFFVATLPNSQLTYADNLSETLLDAQSTFLSIDSAGTEHGVAQNDPPPNGSFPIAHRGRLYMLVGNFLFFSKSLADLTTSTGLIAGRYEEAWPPGFQMDIADGVEVGKGLFSDGQILYIGTQRHIRRLRGDGPSNFITPEIVFNEVGILNQDVWRAIFLEGTPAGTMWLTPDFRCIRSDFNTYQNVGQTIQTTLNSINPAAAQTSWATYIGEGSYNFYVLAVPTGSATIPNTLCIYNIGTGRWFIWTPADPLLTAIFYLNQAGIPRTVINSQDGSIFIFDPSISMDRANGANKIGITSTMRTSFLDMNDATTRKLLNEVELATTQASLLVTLEGATTDAQFVAPNLVVANAPLVQNFLGDYKIFLAGLTTKDRFYRMTLVDTSTTTSTVNDELLSYYSFEVIPSHRI